MAYETLFTLLGMGTIVPPAVLLAAVGLAGLIGHPLSERSTARLVESAVVTGLSTSVGILALMLLCGTRDVSIDLGNWVALPQEHFRFHVRVVFDRLSVPFAILSFVLTGTIGAFASRYLHREPGYQRFFRLYAVFLLGMIVASLAGTIETLFLGWELVGLSSALLVAYFQERPSPVTNGQRVWSVYRVADASFLIAAVALHHLKGQGNFAVLVGQGAWPDGVAALTPGQSLVVGSLLLVAVAGKSALIPFSGWLPRAMEGPTPSSAVFYGALSVHLGTFLLLRVSPLLDMSAWLRAEVVAIGVASAIYAALATRVQTDVKSVLAFASLTQVGIITAEIGLGLRYVALAHMIGHACLRTLQIIRAPTLIHDYHTLENAIGHRLPRRREFGRRWVPDRIRLALYRLSLERGYLDAAIDEYVVRPFVRFFHWCDRLERQCTCFLSGRQPHESDSVARTPPPIELP
jgi:NADH-quinone oxidoreductase subunit L